MLSFLLVSVLLWILERSEANRKSLWWIPFIFVLWVNLHGAYAAGVLILMIFTLAAFAHSWRSHDFVEAIHCFAHQPYWDCRQSKWLAHVFLSIRGNPLCIDAELHCRVVFSRLPQTRVRPVHDFDPGIGRGICSFAA